MAEPVVLPERLFYVLCGLTFLGGLLTPGLAEPRRRRVGLVGAGGLGLALLAGAVLAVSAPDLAGLILTTLPVAAVCGATVGFSAGLGRPRTAPQAAGPRPPARPLREEAPWAVALMALILTGNGLWFLASALNRWGEGTAGGDGLGLGLAALFVWMGSLFLPLGGRDKAALLAGAAVLAALVGWLLPAGLL